MSPDSTIARIKAYGANSFRVVSGAADLAAARQDPPKQLPAAFVIVTQEDPGPNSLGTGGLSQHVAATFAVVLCVGNLRDVRGAKAREDLESLRLYLLQALLLWPPASGFDPTEKGRGKLLAFQDQVLWWQDDFRTGYWLNATV